jgi:hypothetical protein
MSKIKIKLVILGQLPLVININKIVNWKSSLFQVMPQVDRFEITLNADGDDWDFTDDNIRHHIPPQLDGDIVLAITRIPLQDNYYARRFDQNRVCLSFYEMDDILRSENIPLENLILRLAYAMSFVYKKYGNRLPPISEYTEYAHDETRGCLFDMNGVKGDIIYSTHKPKICDSCVAKLKESRVASNLIEAVQNEIKNVKKTNYYVLADLVKKHPYLAIIISAITAICLGVTGSVIASYVYGWLQQTN